METKAINIVTLIVTVIFAAVGLFFSGSLHFGEFQQLIDMGVVIPESVSMSVVLVGTCGCFIAFLAKKLFDVMGVLKLKTFDYPRRDIVFGGFYVIIAISMILLYSKVFNGYAPLFFMTIIPPCWSVYGIVASVIHFVKRKEKDPSSTLLAALIGVLGILVIIFFLIIMIWGEHIFYPMITALIGYKAHASFFFFSLGIPMLVLTTGYELTKGK